MKLTETQRRILDAITVIGDDFWVDKDIAIALAYKAGKYASLAMNTMSERNAFFFMEEVDEAIQGGLEEG